MKCIEKVLILISEKDYEPCYCTHDDHSHFVIHDIYKFESLIKNNEFWLIYGCIFFLLFLLISKETEGKIKKTNKHNAELQGADPGTIVPGTYFPTQCPKWIFIVLVEKKHTKLIYRMPWLYQYPPVPFHRSYKNESKILKNYPPWIMEVLKWNVLISIVIVGKK